MEGNFITTNLRKYLPIYLQFDVELIEKERERVHGIGTLDVSWSSRDGFYFFRAGEAKGQDAFLNLLDFS